MGRTLLLLCAALALSFALGEAVLRSIGFGSPLRYEFDPELSWRLAPNQTARAPSYGTRYRTNSFGWRDAEPTSREGGDVYRIYAIGDSVTFGQGVDRADIYTERVERTLSGIAPTEVFNTGVPNYNAHHYRKLVDRGDPFAWHADLLLIGLVKNDLVSAAEVDALHAHAARGLAFDMDTLRGRGRRASAWFHLIDGLVQRIRYRVLGDVPRGIAYTSGIPDAAAWQLGLGSLDAIGERAARAQLPVLLVVFPRSDELGDVAPVVPTARLMALAERRGWETLDLNQAFSVHADESLFYDIVHPTPRGNEIAADAISDRLKLRVRSGAKAS